MLALGECWKGISVKKIIRKKKDFFHFRYGMQFFMDSLYGLRKQCKKKCNAYQKSTSGFLF